MSNGIPNSRSLDAVAVTDGSIQIGVVIARDGSFFSFDRAGVLVGEFETLRQAVRSIPRVLSLDRS